MMSAGLCMFQTENEKSVWFLPRLFEVGFIMRDLIFVGNLIFVIGKQVLDGIGLVRGLDGIHIQDFQLILHHHIESLFTGRKQERYFGSTSY